MRRLIRLYIVIVFSGLVGMIIFSSYRPAKQKHWIIEGYAVTTTLNMNGFCVSKEALDEAANDLLDFRTVLLDHDSARPIGHIITAYTIGEKLWVKIEISHTEPIVWERIKDGTLSKFSVQIFTIESEMDYSDEFQDTFTRLLKIVILETSVVSVPADRNAKILNWREE